MPISRAKLIKRLKNIGFEGPFPGSDHDYMVRGDNFVRIPNDHRREIGPNLVAEILREGAISRDEWLSSQFGQTNAGMFLITTTCSPTLAINSVVPSRILLLHKRHSQGFILFPPPTIDPLIFIWQIYSHYYQLIFADCHNYMMRYSPHLPQHQRGWAAVFVMK